MHQDLGDHAAVLVHLGLQAGAVGRPVGIGLVVVQLRHREQRAQQVLDAGALGGAGPDDFRVAAPFAGQQLVLGELIEDYTIDGSRPGRSILFNATTIGTPAAARAWLMASSVCGMTPSSAATTSTAMSVTLAPRVSHLGKCLVAGRIDESHRAPVLLDLVSADVLRDAALLVRGHIQADDPVQERSLAVVDVAQHGDDRRTRQQRLRSIGLLGRLQHLLLERDLFSHFDVDAQFRRQQLDRFTIEAGGDGAGDLQAGHELALDFAGRDPDGLGQRKRMVIGVSIMILPFSRSGTVFVPFRCMPGPPQRRTRRIVVIAGAFCGG